MKDPKRINKFISDTGYCSRRAADELISKGQVTVNGKKAEIGTKVEENDIVRVMGKSLKEDSPRIYLAFHKPIGVTSTTDQSDPDNIIDYIGYKDRIFPIGRLDKMSEGLIFLTNDGDIVNKILRAGNNHEKEYEVTVDRPITDEFLRKMGKGVKILDTITKPCQVKGLTKYKFKIILTQGLNRQIRRMCEVLGYDVMKLKRIRIMNVSLKGLEVGKWRYLTQAEMKAIDKMIAASSKTEEASMV
ncbi:MAG: 23S rRNA pseudouridine(2604) synthase RluF [Vallitaleaceae bacterium]|nr:23S rRNA pseudouridine(2604) synthase RluF [Vallitaleaceae bacterium]